MQFSLGHILQALTIAGLLGLATSYIDLNKQSIMYSMRLDFVESQLKNCVSNDIYQVEKLNMCMKK